MAFSTGQRAATFWHSSCLRFPRGARWLCWWRWQAEPFGREVVRHAEVELSMSPPTEEVEALVGEGSGWVEAMDSFTMNYTTREPQSVLVCCNTLVFLFSFGHFWPGQVAQRKGGVSEGARTSHLFLHVLHTPRHVHKTPSALSNLNSHILFPLSRQFAGGALPTFHSPSHSWASNCQLSISRLFPQPEYPSLHRKWFYPSELNSNANCFLQQ